MEVELLRQIIDRAVIHIYASAGVVLMTLITLRWYCRKWPTPWLPQLFQTQVLIAALLVFAFSALREAWDVSQGQPVIKAFTDYASWFIGCGLSSWGLYRIRQ